MQIELDAYEDLMPDDFADTLDDIAFAVIVAMRHLRTMQEQEHHIDRTGIPQIVEDTISQRLIIIPFARSGRLGIGMERCIGAVAAFPGLAQKDAKAELLVGSGLRLRRKAGGSIVERVVLEVASGAGDLNRAGSAGGVG